MKLAEGPTVSTQTTIGAPPAEVWPLVVDIELPARFSSEFQGARWLDERPGPRLGARFRGRNRHRAIGEWETTSVVVACAEPELFGWAVEDVDRPSAAWRFELTPAGDGTLLRMTVRLGPGPSGLTSAIESNPDKEDRIIDRRLAEHERNMAATLAGIKELAENGRG